MSGGEKRMGDKNGPAILISQYKKSGNSISLKKILRQ